MAVLVRAVVRRPGPPLFIAALFALGIGLAGGMWAVVDAALLRPLPYRNGHALVAVMEAHPQRGLMAITPANFLDWSTRATTLESVAGAYPVDVSFTGVGLPERVAGAKVTERFFDVLGVLPVAGRTLQSIDFANVDRVVVLGHALWTRQFGGRAETIGTRVRIDGEIYTVAGVMPREFRTVGRAEIWVPWVMSPEEQRERRFHLVSTIARLGDGHSAIEAGSELAAIYRQLETEHADTNAQWSARAIPLRDLILGDSARALMVLGGAVLVLVTVAGMNVASLLLAWLPSRRHEFLVRIAVGASMTRVVRQVLFETFVWAGVGTLAGLAIATWFVQLFGAVGVSTALAFDFQPRVDARVVLATVVLMILGLAVTTIGPALLAVHRSRDLVPRRTTPARVGQPAIVAIQIALSTVLLCAAAALLVAFEQLAMAPLPRFGEVRTMAIDISRPETNQPDEIGDRMFFQRLLAGLGERREIKTAGAASYVPPTPPLGTYRFAIEGRTTSSEEQSALMSAVSASAFRLLDVPLLRGRLIEERDTENDPAVAVISDTLARRYWPDADPIGRRIVPVGSDAPVTIVGVVGTVRQPLSNGPRAESIIYVPYRQSPWPFMTVLFAPATTVADAVAAVRQEIVRLNPAQAAGSVRVLDDVRSEWLVQPRLQTMVVTVFGLATLLLTLVGLYARIAHGVVTRAREFAIRQALGATPRDVIAQLTGDALIVVTTGLTLGIAVMPFSERALRSLVIDMASLDVILVASVAVLVALTAVLSAYWPARRAGRSDAALLLTAEQ